MPHDLPGPHSTPLEETTIRRRLGIPDDAERAIMFAESSHWDPNWLLTADEYFQRFVGRNLDLALDTLTHEPRRVYSVECTFFLPRTSPSLVRVLRTCCSVSIPSTFAGVTPLAQRCCATGTPSPMDRET